MCVSHSVTGPSETCFFQSFKTENIAYTTPTLPTLCTPHHCLAVPRHDSVRIGAVPVARQECRPINARSSASRKAAAAAAATLRRNTRCHTYIHHLISIHHTPPYAIARRKAAAAAAALRTNTRCQTSIHHLISIHHTPPYAVPFQMAPPNPHLLAVGTVVSANLSQSPHEEVVRMLAVNGHNAIQRNTRPGFIYMICKDCDARCSVSTYKKDAWCVLNRHDAVGRQCQGLTTKKSQKGDARKTPGRQREKSADAAPIKKYQKQDGK